MQSPCSITESLRSKLLQRSLAGQAKYGVTLDRKDLSPMQWITHLQEELLDAANYLEKIIQELNKHEASVATRIANPKLRIEFTFDDAVFRGDVVGNVDLGRIVRCDDGYFLVPYCEGHVERIES